MINNLLGFEFASLFLGLHLNFTEAQIVDFVNTYDQDGSGSLDYPTFHSLVEKHRLEGRAPYSLQEILDAFKPFDLNNDGSISAEDLVHLLQQRGEPMSTADVDSILTGRLVFRHDLFIILLVEITIDGDGRIDIHDFVLHMFMTSLTDDI